ncbi:MAG: tryptophan synthase subunit alpha [Chloroflexota bacterium]|nr:tryptophan synthase subunit alpha [Chloroflexota bacterium]
MGEGQGEGEGGPRPPRHLSGEGHEGGLYSFCNACVNCGVDGMIVPDLPPEEGSELELVTKNHGLDLIYLLAPTSSDERISLVSQRSSGFIYLVSLTGVTGARDNLPLDLEAFISRVKRVASHQGTHPHLPSPLKGEGKGEGVTDQSHLLPLCVGFGISTPEQAKQIASLADGVIIGSQIIHLMESDPSLTSLRDFVGQVREALDSDDNSA